MKICFRLAAYYLIRDIQGRKKKKKNGGRERRRKKKKKNEKQKNLKYNSTKDCNLASEQQVIRLAALIIVDGTFFSMEFVSKTIILPFNKRLKRRARGFRPVPTVNYIKVFLSSKESRNRLTTVTSPVG